MQDTQKTVPVEYWKLCRYLWERVNQTPDTDKESLEVLAEITYHLLEKDTNIAIYADGGFMWELNEWATLKLEGVAQKDYGEGLKSWREVFPD